MVAERALAPVATRSKPLLMTSRTSSPQRFAPVLFLIDSVSIWAAALVFFAMNFVLGRIEFLNTLQFNTLFFVGFTQKGTILLFVLGPLIMAFQRLVRRTSVWDALVMMVGITTIVMMARYFTCAFAVFDRHIYFDLFDAGLEYQTQCAYFSLINFVLAVPKGILVAVSFGLIRFLLTAITVRWQSPTV